MPRLSSACSSTASTPARVPAAAPAATPAPTPAAAPTPSASPNPSASGASASAEPELLALPWHVPLEQWPAETIVSLPRGISRHVVRFVRLHGVVYAVKEVEEHYATREYELLFDLVRRGLPTVDTFVAEFPQDSWIYFPWDLGDNHRYQPPLRMV